MPLKPKDEVDLIKGSCDKNNPQREQFKEKLWEYINGTYRKILIYKARWFEYDIRSLPDDPEDICNDFITDIMVKDKLCTWNWEYIRLKSTLYKMLKNYLIDKTRPYESIEYEKDSCGRKVKDENGSYKIKKIERKRVNLRECKSLFILTEDGEIENPEIYKERNLFENEDETKQEALEYEKKWALIQKIQKKALFELKELSPRDAEIIYMERRKIKRDEIAIRLGIEKTGINKTIQRAYQKYEIIFHRLAKVQGIETYISENGLKKLLIDVTRKGEGNDNKG